MNSVVSSSLMVELLVSISSVSSPADKENGVIRSSMAGTINKHPRRDRALLFMMATSSLLGMVQEIFLLFT